jgi:hypothetical protein
VSGGKFSFGISVTIDGNPADVTFSGTLEGEQLKGTASGGGIAAEFTGVHPAAHGAAAGEEERQ